MLPCIICTKQVEEDDESLGPKTHKLQGGAKDGIKSFTTQLKDIVLKVSSAYRQCRPCATPIEQNEGAEDIGTSSVASSEEWIKSHKPGFSNGKLTVQVEPTSSDRPLTDNYSKLYNSDSPGTNEGEVVVNGEDDSLQEWVAQVEPGVLITFLSLPTGENELKRIRFSRDLFNKWQAEAWWGENCDRVHELYNVVRTDKSLFTSIGSKEEQARDLHRAVKGYGNPASSIIHDEFMKNGHFNSISDWQTAQSEASKVESQKCKHEGNGENVETCSKSDYCRHVCRNNSGPPSQASSIDKENGHKQDDGESEHVASHDSTSDEGNEWVEEDEPGVYITIKSLPGGGRELRRVRFSREKFSERQAKLWWERNRFRIHDQYL